MKRLSGKPEIVVVALLLIMAATVFQPTKIFCQEEVPPYLRDRGTGIPMSIFGTYVRQGELLIYPFYEYYHDNNLEYKPSDFGYPSDQDFRGRYRAHEGIIFIGYGISDKFAVEVEAGIIDARLRKAGEDKSDLSPELKESGLSDVEGQIRWRWNHETTKTPEYFSYFLAVLPTGKKKQPDWNQRLGIKIRHRFDQRFQVGHDNAQRGHRVWCGRENV